MSYYGRELKLLDVGVGIVVFNVAAVFLSGIVRKCVADDVSSMVVRGRGF